MTYSLRTLTNPTGSPEADSPRVLNEGVGLLRFTQEIVLFLGAAVLILLALAMFSFSPKETGSERTTLRPRHSTKNRNRLGKLV